CRYANLFVFLTCAPTPELSTLSLHDALPISSRASGFVMVAVNATSEPPTTVLGAAARLISRSDCDSPRAEDIVGKASTNTSAERSEERRVGKECRPRRPP